MTESIELAVSGMKCGGCEANVKTKLDAIDGVLKVSASSKDKKVNVEFDLERTNVEAIRQAIVAAGFTVD